jgi:hypothetical protein
MGHCDGAGGGREDSVVPLVSGRESTHGCAVTTETEDDKANETGVGCVAPESGLFRAGWLSIFLTGFASKPESNASTPCSCVAHGNITRIDIKAGWKINCVIVQWVVRPNSGRMYRKIVQSLIVPSSDLEC